MGPWFTEAPPADAIDRLRQALTAREKAALRREPGWLVPILREIARPETKSACSATLSMDPQPLRRLTTRAIDRRNK